MSAALLLLVTNLSGFDRPIDNDIVHIEEHKVADCYAILSRNVLLFTGIFTFLVSLILPWPQSKSVVSTNSVLMQHTFFVLL